MAILGAEVLQHGPAGIHQTPYGSFAGKTPQVGGAVVIPMLALLKARNFMAIRNQALTVNFLAWDTSANGGKTGDSANFTLRLIKDGGVPAAPTNAVSEPDSTNMPGTYELALTATEMDADFVTLHGISSTGNIVIFPLFITTDSGIDSQLTVIASDTVVIESNSIVIESNSIVLDSSVAVIEGWGLSSVASDAAAVESELILVHSETTVVQSQTTVIESDSIKVESSVQAIEAWGDPSTPLSDIESSLVIIKSDLVIVESNSVVLDSSVAVIEGWGLSATASDAAAIESELILVHSETTVIQSDTTMLELGIITGTAQTGTLSTTQATTDLTGYANDELIGRVIIFTGGTADGQASDITDYASASGLVTFTAITTAPVNGDTFKIV